VSIPLQIAIGLVLIIGALALGVHLFHETPPPVTRPLPPRPTPARQPEDPRTVLKAKVPAPLDEFGRRYIEERAGHLRTAAAWNPSTHVLRMNGQGVLEKVRIEAMEGFDRAAAAERERIAAEQKKLLL
jgi:hypothetical protein